MDQQAAPRRFEPARYDCPKDHDPQPFVRRGIQMAQAVFGGSKTFEPRAEYCADIEHYYYAAEES